MLHNFAYITIRVLCFLIMLAAGFVAITGIAYWFSSGKRPPLDASDIWWPVLATILTIGAAYVVWGN